MYPSNKKKKVWREEKGNRPVESWGCGGLELGGGGGQGCVCRGALPSSRLASAGPVPPPSRVRVYTRARMPACTRRPWVPAASSRVCARPSLPPASPGHFPSLVCFCLTRGVVPRAAVPGLVVTSSGPHPVFGPLLGLSHALPRCSTDTCPPVGTAAAAAPPRPAGFLPFPLRLCLSSYLLSWQCLHFRVFTPSLGPRLLRRGVTFETWNSRGNLKR